MIFVIIIIILIVSLIFAIPTTDTSFHTNEVIDSVGVVVLEDYYSSGGWQDYTDYAKYYFENPDIENNEYLTHMTENDIEDLIFYVDIFEDWLDILPNELSSMKLIKNYDFDKSIISANDYCYIDDYTSVDPNLELETEPASFNIYFYDIESETLYYFHNNI
ncbi:MAG: hypothetical protein IKU66_07190 [Clostridia bacterium]|nr:hypothetical protein [Clostridia bacterium]